MANTYLIDASKDAALNYLDTATTQLFITSQLVANYTEASDRLVLDMELDHGYSKARITDTLLTCMELLREETGRYPNPWDNSTIRLRDRYKKSIQQFSSYRRID